MSASPNQISFATTQALSNPLAGINTGLAGFTGFNTLGATQFGTQFFGAQPNTLGWPSAQVAPIAPAWNAQVAPIAPAWNAQPIAQPWFGQVAQPWYGQVPVPTQPVGTQPAPAPVQQQWAQQPWFGQQQWAQPWGGYNPYSYSPYQLPYQAPQCQCGPAPAAPTPVPTGVAAQGR